MANDTHCISGLALSLAVHAAILWLWDPSLLKAEKIHVAGDIALYSRIEERAEKQKAVPPPPVKKRAPKKKKTRKIKRIAKKTPAPVVQPEATRTPQEKPIDPPAEPSLAAGTTEPDVTAITEPVMDAMILSHADLIQIYANQVRQRIESRKTYPRRARRQNMEGAVRVRFVLSPTGEVKEITIIRASRFAMLNAAAKKAVLSAAPFPSIPEQDEKEPISLEVTLCFELT
ncbi:energy transducer TonB [Desulfoluna sp.]|uniref:energy transducer TonB n=1 Tax=Desulfoluna sp. TaxID=2045199 RepID=UPI0026037207|nr:TonB family protein [Desulfoluna sp.]